MVVLRNCHIEINKKKVFMDENDPQILSFLQQFFIKIILHITITLHTFIVI